MNWFERLFHRQKMEELLDKELRFHFDQQTADLTARGTNPDEAQRQARLALGGPEQLKEQCRDARGTRWIEDLSRDIHYALRVLRRDPSFTAVALLTLALGIGATTLIFTVVDGVLLKPLPYPDPNQLVAVHGHTDSWNTALFGEQNLAYPDFLDCQRESRSVKLAGLLYSAGTLSEPGEAEHVEEFETSPNLLTVLRTPLFRGRAFLPQEDHPSSAHVAILGNSLWRRRFASDPRAVGSTIVLDGKRYTVIGIAEAGFRVNGEEADVYTPLGQDTATFLRRRWAHPITAIGRLREGFSLNQANGELAILSHRLAKEHPHTNADRSFRTVPLKPNVGQARSPLWLLLGAVFLVLLIACANVASLLLARTVSRDRELAMRVALGARRSRLVRQCLAESLVLSLTGGALGALLTVASAHPFATLWPGVLPRSDEIQPNWQVLLFALAISVLSGVFFGIAPALQSPIRDLDQRLRAGGRTISGGSRTLHSRFVIAEIALAVVILVSAGMLGRALLRLSSLNPGLDIHNVLITRVALSPFTLSNPGQIRAAWQNILDHASQVPGVESVAVVDTVPMRDGNNPLGYSTTSVLPPENQRPIALATCVTPDYLKVTRIPLLAGRFFGDGDRLDKEPVAVIDEVLAKSAFGRDNPIGKRLWLPDMGYHPLKVIGVVGHVRHWGLAGDDEAQVRAQLYYPFAQVPETLLRRWSELMSLAVRTDVSPLSVVEPLRKGLRGATNDQALYEVRTLEQLASDSLASQRFLALLFGMFAAVALLLACLGIYGVVAYLTGQRVPEIGMRIALGATAADVVQLVVRQTLGMILVGVALGTCAAFVAGIALTRLVQGVQPNVTSTSIAVIPVLLAAALFASFIPARRASLLDPVRALRQE